MGNFFKWFVGAADAAGYGYLLIGGNAVNAYGYQRTTLDVHLLHALRDPERAAEGKDMPDILGLIERCDIDTTSVEFTEILDRYADKSAREELFRRLELRQRFRS